MSKLGTVLSIANLGISAANWQQLQGMQQMQAEAEARQAVIEIAKNVTFSLKRSAEQVLAEEEAHPAIAAAKLRLLQSTIEQLGLGPHLFPQLADKEYADQTIRLINDNSRRINDRLSKAQQADVDAAIEAIQIVEACDFYIDNADDARSLAKAESKAEKLRPRNSCLARAGLFLGIFVAAWVVGVLLGVLGVEGSTIAMLMGVLLLAGLISMLVWMNGGGYKKAKKAIKEIDLDVDRYRQIAADHGLNSVEQAQRKKEEAERAIEAFFGARSQSLLGE